MLSALLSYYVVASIPQPPLPQHVKPTCDLRPAWPTAPAGEYFDLFHEEVATTKTYEEVEPRSWTLSIRLPNGSLVSMPLKTTTSSRCLGIILASSLLPVDQVGLYYVSVRADDNGEIQTASVELVEAPGTRAGETVTMEISEIRYVRDGAESPPRIDAVISFTNMGGRQSSFDIPAFVPCAPYSDVVTPYPRNTSTYSRFSLHVRTERDGEWHRLIQRCHGNGKWKRVRLRKNETVRVPLTFGWEAEDLTGSLNAHVDLRVGNQPVLPAPTGQTMRTFVRMSSQPVTLTGR